MVNRLYVDEDQIVDILRTLEDVKNEIDNIASELFYINTSASDSWQGEASKQFSENITKAEQKGKETVAKIKKNSENLSNATGVFLEVEEGNKNIVSRLNTKGLF